MTNNKTAIKGIIFIIILIVLGYGVGSWLGSTEPDQPTEVAVTTEQSDAMEAEESMDTSSNTTMETDAEVDTLEMPTTEPDGSPITSGTYTAYDPSLVANAASGEVLLFFHADWCPSCRALDTDIQANLDNLPPNVTILKVDYDSATELKQQHEVVRQHTLVRVDAEGNKIESLTGLTNSLDQVLGQI